MPQVCLDSDDFFLQNATSETQIFQEDLELFIAFKRLKAQSKNISDSDAIKAFEKRKRSASNNRGPDDEYSDFLLSAVLSRRC